MAFIIYLVVSKVERVMFLLIDTHCHLDDEAYETSDEIISHMPGYMITAGCSQTSNEKTLELVQKYDHVFGVLGIHPEQVDSYQEEDLKFIEEHIQDSKIVGIGEVGLDYHYEQESKERQKLLFEKQLQLADKYHKTVVVHSRDAILDTYELMKKYPNISYVLHCYSSSLEMAKRFLELNVCFGIGGVVTFKNGTKLKEVVEGIDLSHLLLETDSPYLSPEPYRGERNEPKNTEIVAAKIAEIKGISKEEVIEKTGENAKRQFDLNIPL